MLGLNGFGKLPNSELSGNDCCANANFAAGWAPVGNAVSTGSAAFPEASTADTTRRTEIPFTAVSVWSRSKSYL